jgi:hypothetical protein
VVAFLTVIFSKRNRTLSRFISFDITVAFDKDYQRGVAVMETSKENSNRTQKTTTKKIVSHVLITVADKSCCGCSGF